MTSIDRTLGERRLRVSFNPSGNSRVTDWKRMGARFIDELELTRNAAGGPCPERDRLVDRAQQDIETAIMYAVKAETMREDSYK